NTLQAKVGGTWRNVATGVTYDAAGRMTALTHGNGITRSVSYDWDGRVESIAGSLSPQSLEYAWNAVDLIETLTNHAYPSLSQGFDYDALSRLTDVVSASGNHGLDYDANGNRTTHTWGGATDSYSVASTGNRLNSVSATGTRARSYTHDAAGHRTAETIAGNTINHVYDGFARPASRTQPAMTVQQSHGATVSLPAGTWSYGHDGMGRRTFKRAPGNVLSRYLHGAEGNLLAETSPGGTSLTSIYLWLNGQPIGLVRGGQVYHVHADHLGRPEILTNASKAIVWRAENLAFDRKVAMTSIGDYNLGFPGQYYDAEGASWQNWFRTYDGSVGRYTQSDPVGLAGGLNTYAYVDGNPTSLVDPLGLVPASGAMADCLSQIFGQPVSGVNVRVKTVVKNRFVTTRRNSIRLPPTLSVDEFFSNHNLVLHEYYHVLRQWNTGDLSRTAYVAEFLRNGSAEGNRFEDAAIAFAKSHVQALKDCLEQSEKCSK
ncbi:MAG TPA: RHS repeat-associated core domain-containing protein, partial [Promineifilum sp.]|nr:RHS repeat-associated core domain-containing protein [Promineifilum sp.]